MATGVLEEARKQFDEKRDLEEKFKKDAIETQKELWQDTGSPIMQEMKITAAKMKYCCFIPPASERFILYAYTIQVRLHH